MINRTELTQSAFNPFPPRKRDLKKIEIIEATIKSIGLHGFDGTTFGCVGAIANLSTSHLVYYFANRDELIFATMNYVGASISQVAIESLRSAKGWKGQMRALIKAPFVWMERYPDRAAACGMVTHQCTFDKRYKDFNTKIKRVGCKRFYVLLQERFGSKVPKGELMHMSRDIQSLLMGHIIDYITTNPTRSLKALQDRTVKTIFRLIATYE